MDTLSSSSQRTVGGRYRLLEPLGSGGMGRVWRAEDLVLDREVAVKEVAPPRGVSDADTEVLRERTRREARAAARLDHPSAVTVFDVVEEDDRPYLVMELVEARTLADVVREDGPLPPAVVAALGLEVLGALEAAHAQGIVHRDVKPSNVLVRPDGHVVLTDFGIATSTGDSSITSTGVLLGSPAYIAPERARGEQPGPASDLWSLGATLFTAVEGRPPFDGSEPLLVVTAVVSGEHAPFAAAGPLAAALEGLLDKDPTSRLDAGAARTALQAVVAAQGATGQVTRATPAPTLPAAAPRTEGTQALPLDAVHEVAGEAGQPVRAVPRRRRRALPAALALGAVATAAAVGLSVLGGDGGFELAPPGGESSDGAPAAVPAGWTTHTGPAGSVVAVPPSYAVGRFDGAPQYKDPETGRTLRVGTVQRGKDDAVQDRRDQAVAFARTHQAYDELAIRAVDYRGLEAADWEFTYRDKGADLHAYNRVFVTPDGRGWSLFFQTRGSDDWAAAKADFDRIAAAFRTG